MSDTTRSIVPQEDQHVNFTATYSAEDNKLRIYADARFSKEFYNKFKEMGFKWAMHQNLFVKPSWSPNAEDFCIALAGSIEPEEMTVLERAEFRAKRFDGYRVKRTAETNIFSQRAQEISQRFETGQPVLLGHHSQNKAEREQKKMDSAERKAIEAHSKANYWSWKAEGVEHHANRVNDSGVRSRRIKKLFADMRRLQRDLNKHHKDLKTWGKIKADEDQERMERNILIFCGYTGTSFNNAYSDLKDEKITHADVLERSINRLEQLINDPFYSRWISHYLNRIGFETSMLGEVDKYEGKLTATILQGFTRTNGADKPKAKKDGHNWTITSPAPLPLHLSESNTLTLSSDEWINLMKSSGYHVELSKPVRSGKAQTPLLNFDCESINSISRGYQPHPEALAQIKMTKEEYKRKYPDSKCTRLSECQKFRFRAYYQTKEGSHFSGSWVAVFLTDSKAHDLPEESEAINNPPLKEAC